MGDLLAQLEAPTHLKNAEMTETLGRELADQLPFDHVLALSGDLGSGKTTFVRGLASGLEIRQGIHSPTYNIFSIYFGGRQLLYMDAYRLRSTDDLDALDIDSLLTSPFLWVIEWPEMIADAIPDDATRLRLWIEGGHHFIQRIA
ncbi:MAG: tRNA (adenosine(37)-N6)-threonylcarbamoyltransferase complex ATPase subunit type 1 TsaE [Opitutales bacterium]|nr:tRNA (adenosine(37)-N6)-threonylcarbamoyltransferase complex ATPase subunit type 1 TsaE [Opitutales bacterium]NRA28071.1 tRNA (adenosine(37)-N6)-threonylcarbamoyltransferase complex ATPase subunit type 1 TsaE [Opitutales bacterium]